MTTTDRPLLAVCIPTHTGRRDQLEYLLRTILVQVSGGLEGRVEICVSDNATRDGTNDMLQEMSAAYPGTLIHARQRSEVGASSNVLAAIDLASAEYCWMMSSDDAPAPGAVGTIVTYLDKHRPRGGVTVDWTIWTRDMKRRLLVELDPVKPALAEGESERRYVDVEDIIGDLGALFGFMSIHVVNADAWAEGRATGGESWPRSSPLFAHVLGLGAVTRHTRDWTWLPGPLTRARRNAPSGDSGRAAAMMTLDIARVWRTLVTRESGAYRRVLQRWYHLCATRGHVLHYKQEPSHGWLGDLRLLVALGLTLAPLPEFRRRSLPVLLLPAFVVQRSPTVRDRLGAWRESDLNRTADDGTVR